MADSDDDGGGGGGGFQLFAHKKTRQKSKHGGKAKRRAVGNGGSVDDGVTATTTTTATSTKRKRGGESGKDEHKRRKGGGADGSIGSAALDGDSDEDAVNSVDTSGGGGGDGRGGGVAAAAATWEGLELSKWLVQTCGKLGFAHPTPIQVQCVPPTLRGSDVVGCAQTGSGKTAAFALPILDRLAVDPYGIFCLVLTPTRELAFQIADQFRALGRPINVRTSIVVGGLDILAQQLELAKRPHIVIATPGRLAELIRQTPSLGEGLRAARFLVLDEADRLLESSFTADIRSIVRWLPAAAQRQTLLFSATMTPTLHELRTSKLMHNPVFYEQDVGMLRSGTTVAQLQQEFILLPAKVKECYLVYLLRDMFADTQAIVFTGTTMAAEMLYVMLTKLDVDCVVLHSLRSQTDRMHALDTFKSSRSAVLIATDVASRGLDIPSVDLVINYHVPSAATDYVHRVGRTARAGRSGRTVSLVTQYDVARIMNIEKTTQKKIAPLELDEADVLLYLTEATAARRLALMQLREDKFGERQKARKKRNARRRRAGGDGGGGGGGGGT